VLELGLRTADQIASLRATNRGAGLAFSSPMLFAGPMAAKALCIKVKTASPGVIMSVLGSTWITNVPSSHEEPPKLKVPRRISVASGIGILIPIESRRLKPTFKCCLGGFASKLCPQAKATANQRRESVPQTSSDPSMLAKAVLN